MTDAVDDLLDQRLVRVVVNDEVASWPLRVGRRDREIVLVLTAPYRSWTGTGTDVFDALMNLRVHLDAEGVRVCCNGARRNAWASGMQRDMGMGLVLYLLDEPPPAKPPKARTLDEAPVDDVVTVDEQRAFYARWLARRKPRND